MWLCVLFVLLLASIAVFYKVNHGDILSASFISSVSYSIAVFVALLCYSYWGVTYSYKLPLVIMTCILSIFVGEKLCQYLIKKKNWRYLNNPAEESKTEVKVDDRVLLVLFELGVLTCVFQYFYTLHIAKMFGYDGSGYMMEFVRNAYLFHEVPKIYPLVVLCYFQTGVAYVCTLILVKNIINGHPNRHNIGKLIRSNHKYIAAVIPYFILILLTSGRAGFMSYLCATFFMIFVVLLNKNKNSKEVIFKFIKYGFLFAFAFIVIFWLAGYLTGKSQNYGFFDTLSKYVGSSIAGLNDHLVNREPKTDFQTFYGVKTFLNRFGFNIPIPEMYKDGITFPNNSGTNLYTAIWIYYNDFGWFGVIFLNIIFGFVVTLFENFAKRSGNDIWKIIYGYYGYFLIRQIFAEDFFSYMLTTTRILDLFSIVCCYYLLYKPFWKVGTKNPLPNEPDKLKILFLPEYDYWDAVRSKLERKEGILLAETFSKNKLWYYHTSIRLNSYVPLPLKRIWYPEYFQVNKPESVELILFFEYVASAYDKKYLKYLRKKYPNAKLAFFIVNPINHENRRYLEKILPLYDKVITFDEKEAGKNGFLYFNGLYERDETIRESANKSDVFFVGRGKDRLDIIHEIYKELTARNIKCDFYVNNVEKEKQLQGTDIHYNSWLNYRQVLQHVVDTKCVLEILQGEQHGFTMRTCEAIIYKRRLITNNQSLKEQPFYDPRFMCIIEKASDIPDDFLSDTKEVEVSGADFSVERFINFLETI